MPIADITAALAQPDVQVRLVASLAIGWAATWTILRIARARRRMLRDLAASPAGGAHVDASEPPHGRTALGLLSLAIAAAVGWLLLQFWGVDTDRLLAARGLPLRAMVRVLVIVAAATAAIELSRFAAHAVTRRLAQSADGAHDRRRLAKRRTVTPLATGLVNAIVVLVAMSMLLSQAGIEIAPLLAGAGVAGIAIGFGAQTLVKDLFTGAFLIVEDIVSAGDTVEIAGVVGIVEEMTLRTIRLRDYDGTLHILPYGEAQVIHNKTSGWSCFTFELAISYFSDIDRAENELRRAAEDLGHEAGISGLIRAPLELIGIDRLADNGVILKGRIRTAPGVQARVGAAFLARAKARLQAADVLIAHRSLPAPPYEAIADQPAMPHANGKTAPPA